MRGDVSHPLKTTAGFLRDTLPRRLSSLGIGRRSRWASFLTAASIYVVIFIGITVWLGIHGENTTQRRIAQSPSITVLVEKPATPPPGATASRSDVPPVAEAASPDAPLLPVTKPLPAATPEVANTPASSVEPVSPTAAPASTDTLPEAPLRADEQQQAPESAPAITPANGWQTQTRAFDKNDKRPRIALIVTNLGMTTAVTQTAVKTLPANVTLAFQTIAPSLGDWIAQARLVGHEVLLAVPMEPNNYPQNDPGPQTLLTGLPAATNTQRLTSALAHSPQILGIIPLQGETFVKDEKALAPVFDTLHQHNLVFVDGTLTGSSAVPALASVGHIPFVQADALLDAAAARSAIDQALADLETRAKQNGSAVGIALPYPIAFEQLNAWIKTLPGKGLVLAPVSAVLRSGENPVSSSAAVSASKNTSSVIRPNKEFGTTPRPKDDLSAIKRH